MSALSRKPPAKNGQTAQDFTTLVNAVRRVHDECAVAVSRTVNTTLTLRNWLIGSYIRDYEQSMAPTGLNTAPACLKRFRTPCKDAWIDAIPGAIWGYAANCSMPIRQFGNH